MNKDLERNPRKALGKGLSALLPRQPLAPPEPLVPQATAPELATSRLPEHFEEFQSLNLNEIEPGDEQPRESFDGLRMQELADSIKANGVIQPITVCKTPSGRYKIIAGERRWRAARIAGLTEIPALVRKVEKEKLLELALIENIQREDLNPIEIALAFHRLSAEHGLSHEEIAARTGKERSTITNFLRLLKLSPLVRNELIGEHITMGHARALLNIPNEQEQFRACQEVINKQLSVRETEAYVKQLAHSPISASSTREKREPVPLDPNIRAALEEMSMALGTRVKLIPRSEKSGRIEIEYYSQDDLDRIYSVIVKS
jgi:ParB family chromosome partitioning protein